MLDFKPVILNTRNDFDAAEDEPMSVIAKVEAEISCVGDHPGYWATFPDLRSPQEFAKNQFLNNKKLMRGMLKWSNRQLTRSLKKLPSKVMVMVRQPLSTISPLSLSLSLFSPVKPTYLYIYYHLSPGCSQPKPAAQANPPRIASIVSC